MKKSILIFILPILFVGGLLVFKDDEPITNHDSSGTEIVAFGDSLIYGMGSNEGGGFVSILEKDLGESIINLGVPGDTTADGVKRIDKIFEHDPRIVIVLLGGNDYLREVPIDETFANLGEIIDEIHARGAMVLLLGIQGGLLKDNYEPRFKALAKEKNVGYVTNVLDNIVYNRNLMSDAIHPNDRGYLLIAEKVEKELKKMLK